LLGDPASTEQQQDAESSEAGDLQRKIRRIMLKVERSLTSTVTHGNQSHNNSVLGAEAVSNNGSKKKFKFPKFEIKKFGGEYTDWLSWWAQYKIIHEDEDLEPSEKFQYLIQSLETDSRPYQLITGYPITNANYPKVIATLTKRYGDKVIMSQYYVRKLLKIAFSNVQSREKTLKSSVYDELE